MASVVLADALATTGQLHRGEDARLRGLPLWGYRLERRLFPYSTPEQAETLRFAVWLHELGSVSQFLRMVACRLAVDLEPELARHLWPEDL